MVKVHAQMDLALFSYELRNPEAETYNKVKLAR